MPYKNKADRNFKREYETYQGTEEQKKNRAKRNKARADMVKAGRATKGDGSDVDGLIAAVDSAATAGTATGTTGAYLQAGTSPYAILGGKAYAAADTLDLVLGGTVAGTEELIIVIERLSVAHLL